MLHYHVNIKTQSLVMCILGIESNFQFTHLTKSTFNGYKWQETA